MRVRFRFAVTVVLCALVTSSAHADKYTLKEILERVRVNYAGVEAAKASLDVANAQMSEANRLWFPTGDLTYLLTGSPKVRCYDNLDASGNPTSGQGQHNTANCINTNVTDLTNGASAAPFNGVAMHLTANVTQPLYTFGKIEAARAAAKAGKEVATRGVDQAIAQAKFDAQRAYWGLKWARASTATLEDGRKNLAKWVDQVDKDLDSGKTKLTQTDLMRLKIALDNIELGALDVKRAEQTALAGLRVLLDDQNADIDDDELNERTIEEHPQPFYEDAARMYRPEAKMLDAAKTAAHAGRSLRFAEMFPDLGLLAQVNIGYAQNVDKPQNAFLNNPNAIGAGVYLVLHTNLDYIERWAKWKQAKADEHVVEAKRRQAIGGIALELDRAYADAMEARKRMSVTAHGEKVARGWFTAMNQNAETGLAESRDLVESARSYFEMRLRHLQAIMDVNVTQASLERAAGL